MFYLMLSPEHTFLVDKLFKLALSLCSAQHNNLIMVVAKVEEDSKLLV